MQYNWVRSILIGLSVLAIVSVAITVTLGFQKISSVQERYSDHRALNEKLKLARGLVDNVNVVIAGFTSIALELEPEERQQLIDSADKNFEQFQRTVQRLTSSGVNFLTEERIKRLDEAVESIAHAWEEIRRKAGGDFTQEEKAHHFLRMQENTISVQ